MTKRQLAERLIPVGTHAAYLGGGGGREGAIRDAVRMYTKAELASQVERAGR